MQLELLSLQRELGITFVLVTHDQQEALSMSDRICIMGSGRIAQIGTPRQLYDHPVNRYVAGFVGRANILPAKVIGADHSHARVVLDSGDEVVVETSVAVAEGDMVDVMIRPESLRLAAGLPAPATTMIEVTVTNRIFLGEHIEFLLTHPVLGALQVLVSRQAERGLPDAGVGAITHLVWDHGTGLVIGHNN
jgi:spermidine/putrescine transport system ATP-binding protein